MNGSKIVVPWLLGGWLCACNIKMDKPLPFISVDSSIHLNNGIIYYRSVPFSGNIKEMDPGGSLMAIKRIQNGKQEGLTETFYQNGKRESMRWYTKGEKDSIHTGWWENGNIKYEYHFTNGVYHGFFTEWYQDGKMYNQVMYANGKEVYGRGWRENGKLYMNFVIKNGRRYGMNNSNLCYALKNEKVK